MLVKDEVKLQVSFTALAEAQLRAHARGLEFYSGYEETRQAVQQTLSLDPRPTYTKAKHVQGMYGYTLDRLLIVFFMCPAENSPAKALLDLDSGLGEGDPCHAAPASTSATTPISPTAIPPEARVASDQNTELKAAKHRESTEETNPSGEPNDLDNRSDPNADLWTHAGLSSHARVFWVQVSGGPDVDMRTVFKFRDLPRDRLLEYLRGIALDLPTPLSLVLR
jgi:hypothetical protein